MATMSEQLDAAAVLTGNQSPLDHLEGAKDNNSDSDVELEEVTESPSKTYVEVANTNNAPWWLELHLFREDKGNDFRVEYAHGARLAYGRLHVPKGGMISIDNTACVINKKLMLQLHSWVKAENLNITQALEVRPGLKTRPLQNPDTEKVIKIDYAPIKMDNIKIDQCLSIFGDIVKKTEHVIFRAKPEDCEWEKMMDGVITPERSLVIKIKHNIPSFVQVDGVRLRIAYAGQPKTCGRCHRYWSACPGGGKIEKCKKAKGPEKSLKQAMKDLIVRIQKKESNPQEEMAPLIPKFIPDPDEITFSGFKENTTIEGFTAWLDANEITFVAVMVFKGAKPGTFTISNTEAEDGELFKLAGNESKVIVDKLHGKMLDGKRITVVMTCLTTPQKVKKRVITLDSSAGSDPSIEEINISSGDGGEKEKTKNKKKEGDSKGTPHPAKSVKSKGTNAKSKAEEPKAQDPKTSKLSQTKLNFSTTPGRQVGAKAPREESSGSEAGSPSDKKSPSQKQDKKKSKGAAAHHKF